MQKRNWESMNFVQIGMFCLQRQLFVHSFCRSKFNKKKWLEIQTPESPHYLWMWDTKLKMLTAVWWDQVPHLTENSGSHLPVISKKDGHISSIISSGEYFTKPRSPLTNLSGQPRRLCDEPRCNTPRLARVDRHGDLEGWATHLPCGFRWSRPLTSPQRKKGHGKVETKRTASHLRVSCPNRSTGSWYQQIFRIESESHPLKRNKHVLHLWVSLCKFVLNS